MKSHRSTSFFSSKVLFYAVHKMGSDIDPASQQLDNNLHQYLLNELLPPIDDSSDLQMIDNQSSLLDPSLQNQSASAIHDEHNHDQVRTSQVLPTYYEST